MTLKEKMCIVVNEFLLMDENDKRYIKRNIQKEYMNLEAREMIKILRLKSFFASREVYLHEDMIWYFMRIFAMNNFKNGTYLFGTAMKKLSNKYSSIERKLEVIINQQSMEESYAKTLLLRQIRFLNSEKICLNLETLFTELLMWNNEDKITQTNWINQYI